MSTDLAPDLDAVTRLLALRTWAVVGLSDDTSRAAHGVAAFLQAHGTRIVPVHPRAVTVHGEQGYSRLADVPFPVDVVNCFVRSELVGSVVDDAIAVGASGIWMQLGVVDEGAASRARDAGLTVVMDRCPKIDWGRYAPA
ncbi:MAG: CoA-binding protein [Mycobacteriales bacterium]|nr:CoA-binding protein [Mycobacteriales bacterium]